ncbi:MAG TPA: histidine kinase [Fulvivirga sp.]|nr:histidine kinase [Fulvivirga sp.]
MARVFQTSSADSVKKFAKMGYELSRELNYSKGEVQSLSFLGIANRMVSKYDSSLFFFGKALQYVNEEDETTAEINMGIGGVYYYQNVVDSALHYFVKAAEGFERLGLKKRMAAAYSNLGIIMNATGRDKKALDYFRKALNYASEYHLLNVELPTLINLAVLYENRENYDSALYYAKSCYDMSKENNMTYGVARSLLILSNIYSQQKHYGLGLSTANEGIKLFSEMDDQIRVRNLMYKKALALRGLKKHAEALGICKTLIEQMGDTESIKEQVYLLASSLSTDLNRPNDALSYHLHFFEIYKTNAIETQKEQLVELETKYDTEKKSREIERLNDQAKIQELKIEQRNTLIIVAISIFIILILVLLLFFRQRNLRKQNELLGLEQRFLRTQMNPHFIFNALGAIQKFVIKSDPMQGATFIAKFSALMRKVLEHSREEFITIEEEIETLKNYLDLQKLRFEDQFDYEIQVSENMDTSTIRIPPMFGQPFIENALEHGIAKKQGGGKIVVAFEEAGNDVRLTIKDNGTGLDNNDNRADHKSLATQITQERLQMLSTKLDKTDLSIKNLKDDLGKITGVEVSLLLPTSWNL